MLTVMRSSNLAVVALLALAISPLPVKPMQVPLISAASTGSWTEYHHDDAHTGYDSSLPTASSASAGWTSATLDGEVFGETLIYNGVVYAATLNNTVYALRQSDGTTLWSKNVGPPQTSGWSCGNISPTGILGTPVIDTAANRIYVVAEITGATPTYHLFGLDLVNFGNIVLDTALAPTGFDWAIQQERGALALHNGYVYVPFGGRLGDCGNYNGWVVGVPTSGIGTPNVYKTADLGSGLWGAGGLVVDDATGNVFGATGNGVAGGCNTAGQNDAVVRLSPTLALQDWFMPPDWQNNWCLNDQDLGSAGPLLISSNLLFQAGKHGGGFLLNPNSLGGVDGQLYPPKPYSQAEVCLGNHNDATFGSFAYAAPFVYVECEGHGLVALNVNTSTPSFSPCDATCAAPDWSAGGFSTFGPPIVAAGAVWVVNDGGGLYGFNASTGAQIYHSAGFGANRFVTPAEAGGAVYVPSRTVIRSFDMTFFNTWGSLGGVLTSGPDASSWDSSRADVFVRGLDNGLYHKFWGGAWSNYEGLGGALTSDPGAVSWGPNRIDVFVRGTDNALYHRFWYGAWSNWESLSGVLTTSPDVASWGSGRLDVFVRGTDNALWHRFWDVGGWSNWESLGGTLASDPTAVSWGPNRIDVFARAADNTLMHRWWDGTQWNPWESLGGSLTSAADAASCASGHLDVFGLGASSALYRIGFNGSTWGAWQSSTSTWSSEPGAVCLAGTSTIYVFERGTDNALWQSATLAS